MRKGEGERLLSYLGVEASKENENLGFTFAISRQGTNSIYVFVTNFRLITL